MTTYTGTTGDNVWTNIHAGDTVDGLAGDDTVSVDLSAETRAITYNAVTAATATGMIPVSATRIRNVEHIAELKTGSGADTLTISLAQGAFTWYAGTGVDKLVLDYSANTSGFSVYSSSGGYYITATGSQVVDVETLVITGGSGADDFSGIGAKAVIDGGAGMDSLALDLGTATANIAFNAVTAATAAGMTLADGTSIKNIEHITSLATGSGNDTFTTSLLQGGFDWASGSGNDRLVFDGTTDNGGFAAYLSGSDYYISANGSYAHDISSGAISGGHGNDDLSGTSGDDILKGGSGNDTLNGLQGINAIDGGAGTDMVSIDLASSTADVVYDALAAATATGVTLVDGSTFKNVEKLSELDTGSGNDTLTLAVAQGAFTWHAGDGTDRLNIDYTGSTSALSAYVTGDSYYMSINGSAAYNVESVSVTGGSGNDDISGTDSNDILKGGAGNDVLNGLKGVSTIDGGTGVDSVSLDLSDATAAVIYNALSAATATGITLADGSTVKNVEKLVDLSTGSGDDQLTVTATQGTFNWYAAGGNDRLTANYSTLTTGFSAYVTGDSYYLSGTSSTAYTIESVNITGGLGDDDISGTSSDDTLAGGSGDDILNGLTGVSQLDGGVGDDTVSLDLTAATVVILYNAATAATTSGVILADGSRIRNAEHIGELDTGSGDDMLTVSLAQAGFTWFAHGGNDRLVADYSADTVGFSAYVSGNSYYLSNTSGTAYDIENVNITGGSGADDIGGTDGNDTLTGGGGDDTLDGGAGVDTASYASAAAAVSVSLLLQGAPQNTVGAGFDRLTTFENLLGSAFADTLTGNSSNNQLDGGAGADTLKGGLGDDSYIVDNAGDVATEVAGQGTDTVYASVNFNGSGQDIENITLTGLSNVSAIGNTLANTLIGNTKNNILNGLTGADTMSGGLGNDTYVVDNIGDSVLEKGEGGGLDAVQANITYTLAQNVESLILIGNKAINGTGNALDNYLTGNIGANLLDGGEGSDRLIGGGGNDTYIVDSYGDVVTEGADAGQDVVWSSQTHILAANVEDLVLTGIAAINGTGNDLDNMLTGNGAINRLDGGIGTDTLVGGGGDDVYTIDHYSDVIIETAGGGDDIVIALYDYRLPNEVENMILTGDTPTTGYGNDLANQLTGNANNNYLEGLGGADILRGNDGNDVLVGGAGTDKLYGGIGADSFEFLAAGTANGIDRVQDFVSGTDFLAFNASDYGFAVGATPTAAQFTYGTAATGPGAQFYFNLTTHTLYFDASGAGGAAGIAIAIFDNAAVPVAADFHFL